MTQLLYWLDVADRTFLAKRIEGLEALSAPFRFVVRLVNDGARLSHRSLLRAPATLRLERGASRRAILATVTAVRVAPTRLGSPEVELVLEPTIALLRYRVDLRVFRDKTVPEIVTEVLAGIGVETQLRLRDEYARRPYCVQWRETELDFMHRLLEDEGIFYFLRGSVVVLADSTAAYEELPALRFHGDKGMVPNEAVTRLAEHEELVPALVTLRDFHAETPSLDMEVHAETAVPGGVEWYDYPGEYRAPDEGQRRATRMAQAFACASTRFEGEAVSCELLPAARFTLTDIPDREDTELAVTALRHSWNDGGSARTNRAPPPNPPSQDANEPSLSFEAIAGDVAFVPPRVTRVPAIMNPHTAFVTGPAGADVHNDVWGRVKVHFHWDRRQALDDRCSDWVPVLQDNTGHSSAIPRTGWEVLVHFLEGDPDRPVVLGRLYNAADPFPMALPENKTSSRLGSLSSPGRDGSNVIRMEDRSGHEQVDIRAERDETVVVANDKKELVARNELRSIGRDEAITIGRDHSLSTGAGITASVGRNQTYTVGANRDVKVGVTDGATVQGDRSASVGGVFIRRVGTTDSVSAKRLEESVGGVALEVARSGQRTEAHRLSCHAAGGVHLEIAGADKRVDSGSRRGELIGAADMCKAREVFVTVAGKRRTKVGLKLRAESVKEMQLISSDTSKFHGKQVWNDADSAIVLEVGSSKVVLKDGLVLLQADTIRVAIDGDNALAAIKSTQA